MAVIGSYGGKTFKVNSESIYTIKEGIKFKFSLNMETQEKEKNKPSTYIKGINLETLSFQVIILKQKNTDVLNEIKAWRKIVYSGKAHSFILGGKRIGSNNFIAKSVDVEETKVSGKGELLKAILNVELEEYVRTGKKKKEGGK